MPRSRSPLDYGSGTEIGCESMRVFEDCYISDGVAVQDEVPDNEHHRKVFQQAEQCVQRGRREKRLQFDESSNTNAKEVTRIRKLSEDPLAHFSRFVDARLNNNIFSDIYVVGDVLHVSPSIPNEYNYSDTGFDGKLRTSKCSLLRQLLNGYSLQVLEDNEVTRFLRATSNVDRGSDPLQ